MFDNDELFIPIKHEKIIKHSYLQAIYLALSGINIKWENNLVNLYDYNILFNTFGRDNVWLSKLVKANLVKQIRKTNKQIKFLVFDESGNLINNY